MHLDASSLVTISAVRVHVLCLMTISFASNFESNRRAGEMDERGQQRTVAFVGGPFPQFLEGNVEVVYRVYRLSRTLSGLGGPNNFIY